MQRGRYHTPAQIKNFTSVAICRDNKGMEILGPLSGAAGAARKPEPAFTLGQDMSCVIRQVPTVAEARALPVGSVVGDLHGGLTFNDAVAAALEARSLSGWQEIETAPGDYWTVIVLNR
jgi:hypothetical protein